MHIIIIITIIAVIVIIQLRSFKNTKWKINDFLWIFPAESSEYHLNNQEEIDNASYEELADMLKSVGLDITDARYTKYDEEGNDTGKYFPNIIKNDLKERLDIISINHDSETLKTIVNSINDYLKNNKTVSDFHLMKDIVDRNCDAKEEEISTQIPVPLYWGLVGTMAGILIGVISLVFSGELSSLLGSEPKGIIKWIVDLFHIKTEGEGIESLFGGVAIAMIASILGIWLTMRGANKFKTAKLQTESDKHTFLSWIQAKLLPTLSDNVVGVIREMTGNLENFNKEFSDNTSNLGEALAKVNDSYKLQTQLINAVNRIQEGRTAATNLTLLNKLIECSGQIEQLANYLQDCNQYLTTVRVLNDKLDGYEKRAQLIEQAGSFFTRNEKFLAESIDYTNNETQNALKRFNERVGDSLKILLEFFDEQIMNFNTRMESKTKEIDKIVEELKNLTDIKKAIVNFESATEKQNKKIDNLAQSIEKLAQIKVGGGTVNPFTGLPRWIKIAGIIIGGSVGLAGLVVVAYGILMLWNVIF